MLVPSHALRQDTCTEVFNFPNDATTVEKKCSTSCDEVLDVFLQALVAVSERAVQKSRKEQTYSG